MNDSSSQHNSHVEFDAILAQINASFSTHWESCQLGEHEFRFLVVSDPESLLDEETLLQSHDELEVQPYWAQAWDAAFGLAEFILDRGSLKGKSILELGCGLGITGSIAASLGATVILGDYATPALDFARINSWPWRQRCTVQKINWRSDMLPAQFDLILGADILYDRAEIEFLDRFCRSHLKKGVTLIHADPNRALTVDLVHRLESLGWNFHTTVFDSKITSKKIRIIESSLKPGDVHHDSAQSGNLG